VIARQRSRPDGCRRQESMTNAPYLLLKRRGGKGTAVAIELV